ncbi:hypothetical protein [Xanthomonas sp. 60]
MPVISSPIATARHLFMEGMLQPLVAGTKASGEAARATGFSSLKLGNAPRPGRVPSGPASPSGSGIAARPSVCAPTPPQPERMTLPAGASQTSPIATYLHTVRCARKFWQAREVESTVARPALESTRADEILPALPTGLADAMRANRLRTPEPARLGDLVRGQLPKRVPHFQQSYPLPQKNELHPAGLYHRLVASRG